MWPITTFAQHPTRVTSITDNLTPTVADEYKSFLV